MDGVLAGADAGELDVDEASEDEVDSFEGAAPDSLAVLDDDRLSVL